MTNGLNVGCFTKEKLLFMLGDLFEKHDSFCIQEKHLFLQPNVVV